MPNANRIDPEWVRLLRAEQHMEGPAFLPRPWEHDDLAQLDVRRVNLAAPVNYKYGPELWQQLIEGVREIYDPEWVVVAGGAVRDHLLQLPPKDVDIFVRRPKVAGKQLGELLEQANCLGWQNIHQVGRPGQYGGQKPVEIVIAGDTLGHHVEMILVKEETPEQMFDSFDFEICKCWYDGEIHTTPKASVDIQKRQFTPSGELTEASMARFNRINERHGKIFKLNHGQEPWYQKFAKKEKVQ